MEPIKYAKRLTAFHVLLAFLYLSAFTAYAQDGNGGTDGDFWSGLIRLIIPVLTPVIIALLKKLTPTVLSLPKFLLPIIAPIIGAIIEIVNHFVQSGNFESGAGLLIGAVLGALGVWLREVYDQLKKTLSVADN